MRTLSTLLVALAVSAASLHGQAPNSTTASTASPSSAKEIVLTGTTTNVKDSGTTVTIRLFRWSTDEERTALIAAFTAPPTGRQGGAGRGAPAAAAQDDQQDQDEPSAAQGRGQGQAGAGRGQGQRGQDPGGQGQAPATGRGARGGAPASTAPTLVMQALQKAPNLGYLWTSEPTGYSVKHAWRTPQPDGSQRVVIITEPRLGAYSPAWTMSSGTPTDYGFTLLEFRLGAKAADGKSSLTSKVVVDPNTKQLTLEDFATVPVILTKVKLTTK
jgi:hypothetical protein